MEVNTPLNALQEYCYCFFAACASDWIDRLWLFYG